MAPVISVLFIWPFISLVNKSGCISCTYPFSEPVAVYFSQNNVLRQITCYLEPGSWSIVCHKGPCYKRCYLSIILMMPRQMVTALYFVLMMWVSVTGKEIMTSCNNYYKNYWMKSFLGARVTE